MFPAALTVYATGPLDPVPLDPDSVRHVACRLVEQASVCAPPAPPKQIDVQAPPAGGFSMIGLLLQGVLILAVVALLFVIIRVIVGLPPLKRRQRAAPEPDDDPDREQLVGMVVIDARREPADWRREAEQHRGEGRWRDALRCRYRALVGDLARRGLLDEIPGRTTGEERAQLAISAPNVFGAFVEAADLFDAAWFGHVTAGPADDDRLARLDADILARAVALPQRVPRRYQETLA